jgi:hypothetical protein
MLNNSRHMKNKTNLVAVVLALMLSWAQPAFSEEPIKLTVCQLLEDPGRYNHHLVEISGTVSRGFEDFMLHDRSCSSLDTIWLELGGKHGSEVIYCCGMSSNAKRKTSLTVEGIETRLIADATFDKFQKVTNLKGRPGKADVTLIGRYFSGTKQTLPGGTFWVGYGHLGMSTLLAIEQVTQVRGIAPDSKLRQ